MRALVTVDQTPKMIDDEDWSYGCYCFTDDKAGRLFEHGVPQTGRGRSVDDVMPALLRLTERLGGAGLGGEAPPETLALLRDHQQDWRDVITRIEVPQLLIAGRQSRRLAYPALEPLGPVLTEDVCVPKVHVPEMLARIERIAQEHHTTIANIAHAGDGNLHPLLIVDPDDEQARVRAQAAFSAILSHALDLGGTVTGEHGVGLLKRSGLEQELSPAGQAMHRAVKLALDPGNISNPGKMIAAGPGWSAGAPRRTSPE